MKIELDQAIAPSLKPDSEINVLIYTYDPSEQALVVGMYLWIDQMFPETFTHQNNVARAGYENAAHCDGFDLRCSSRTLRMFLNSWRRYFDDDANLAKIDKLTVRSR